MQSRRSRQLGNPRTIYYDIPADSTRLPRRGEFLVTVWRRSLKIGTVYQIVSRKEAVTLFLVGVRRLKLEVIRADEMRDKLKGRKVWWMIWHRKPGALRKVRSAVQYRKRFPAPN